ncbi:histidine kinase [Chryseolinea sp. T2]|uniref:sensor histidine kinase n=1 Tax=Chryseolinea sp. T2 TaxID=3129255 RepID=UPI0030773501
MNPFLRYRIDHVLFWSATVLFHMYTRWSLIEHSGAAQFLLEVLVRNGLLAALIYFNLNVLVPRFARIGRWVAYSVSLLAAIICYALLKDAHDLFQQMHAPMVPTNEHRGFVHKTFYNISISVFYVTFSVALQLSREWWQQREILRQIAFDQVNTELAYLKAQINPHFLFNSINTIYFQIDKENSTARDMLSTFADMLRYQLYECNGSSIPIEKEAAYLRNYVDLQRMRRDGHYSIEFSADDNVRGFSIAPLLLLPFVENAFKHGSHGPGGNEIEITLSYSASWFRMIVYNTSEFQNGKSGGIGLQNVRRRLELLYKDRYELTTEAGQSDYRVQLDLLIESDNSDDGLTETELMKKQTVK